MIILGINAYHGDVSAVLVRDGRLVVAAEEERFQRVKHWAGFPAKAIRSCLESAKVLPEDIDYIALSRNPRAHFFRKAIYVLGNFPSFNFLKDRAKNAVRVQNVTDVIAECLDLDPSKVRGRVNWVEHHPAHLASSFFVSPFERAAVCAIDGFGDFVSTSMAEGQNNKLKIIDQIYFPHSLGLMYLAVTQFLGFPRYGDEFKVMGLAPYGKLEFLDEISQLIRLKPNGGFELDISYFCHWSGNGNMTWDEGEPTMDSVYSPKLEKILGPARGPNEPLEPRHEGIAASLQAVFEKAVFHVLNALHEKTKIPYLCFSGGCAMNSVANGKIRDNTPFEEVYIQPASGDNGTALGAAFYVWNQILERNRDFVMTHSFWGDEFGADKIENLLTEYQNEFLKTGVKMRRFDDEDSLCQWTVKKIAEGNVVGWFQGRMEWGARALGNRSILADPRRSGIREIINLKIKIREKFRPFAPSIKEEAIDEYFIKAVHDPFMSQVFPVQPEKKEKIPSVIHVDGTGRLQSVSREDNPLFWKLLGEFEILSGVPVLLNTSFNENEPIVRQPSEALECFLRTRLDVLAIGNFTLEK